MGRSWYLSDQPGTGADITAADLEADIEVPTNARPATTDPDSFVDDGLGMGDGPDVQAPADSGS